MSVSVIERRRIFTHAEDASIVLWLLKRKRWKYKSVEVVDWEDSESRGTCLYASLFTSICVTRLAGVQVSDTVSESLRLPVALLNSWHCESAARTSHEAELRCHCQSICHVAMLDLQHLSNLMGLLALCVRK